MGRVVVVGSLNLDLVVRVEALPRPGETVSGQDLETFEGGKGANQAVAAARAGAQVRFVGCVGDDAFGDRGRSSLASEGIETRHLHSQPLTPTGVALIGVDARGENAILVSPGANARLDPAAVEAALADLESDDIVLCQLEIPLICVERAFEIGRRRGARTILDPAPAKSVGLEKALRDAWLVTPNDSEASTVFGPPKGPEDLPSGWIAAALSRGPERILITRGASGALSLESERIPQVFAAPQVVAVDSTGAGDAFNGALAAALAEDAEWEVAVRAAIGYASRSVLSRGAQASLPRLHWSEALSAADEE